MNIHGWASSNLTSLLVFNLKKAFFEQKNKMNYRIRNISKRNKRTKKRTEKKRPNKKYKQKNRQIKIQKFASTIKIIDNNAIQL